MSSDSFLSSPYTWAITAVSASYLVYRYATRNFTYFSDQGIPGPKPWPIYGNMWGLWKKDLVAYDMGLLREHGKVLGYFDGPQPNLWIADVDLIRSIFVKDFDHFVDRRPFEVRSRGIRKWLTTLRGQEWKDVRSSVTPTFTSGKIKRMSLLINECIEKLTKRFENHANNGGKIDAKKEFSAFTMDVIARCAFGLTIETLGEKDDPFVENAKVVFHQPGNKSPLIVLPNMFPKLFSMLLDKLFVTKEMRFFMDLLDNLISERSHSNQRYNDFIEMATESISEFTKEVDGKTVPVWTKEEVAEIVMGQSTLFMLAGFDTTATTLTNLSFLLSRHQDVQEKLYDEVASTLENFGDVSHDMVQNMPYLEQVINETLRIYPPAVRIDRQCTKDYTYDGRIHIRKGMTVTVPIYALHHLEEYYPEPEKFLPDRWAPENKANRNPYAFMPFGMGPRNCVGMRFAMEEIKMAVCAIVKQFRFYPVEETPEKLTFDDGVQFVLQPMHAVVGIETRL